MIESLFYGAIAIVAVFAVAESIKDDGMIVIHPKASAGKPESEGK